MTVAQIFSLFDNRLFKRGLRKVEGLFGFRIILENFLVDEVVGFLVELYGAKGSFGINRAYGVEMGL